MLKNIFQKKSIFYLYRLVKPNISQFKSIQELQYEQKQRQLALLQKMNVQILRRNKNFTKQKQISQNLNVSQDYSKQISQKKFKFTAISPKNLKSYTLQQSLNDQKIDYPFLLQEIQQNLPDFNSIPMHFSYKRGITVLQEYQMDKKTAYVFNLPQNVNQAEISQKIGIQTIKQIKIQYCRLGLPAYAKIYFNSDEAVTNLVLNNKNYIELNNRLCFIKTHFDKDKIELKNRRLIIKGLQEQQNDLIVELSKFGRIIHLDYPTFITRNVSLQQVREKYKNSDSLIKINIHAKDGSIISQYYPSIEQVYKMNTSTNDLDFESHLIEKRQKIKAAYRNRMRYAQQIDVFEGKENQISIKNMGYCVVTYSCTQQAQNCYFNKRLTHRISLLDSKTTEEFQFDQHYRKRILRFIDCQYRKTKQLIQNSKSPYQKQSEDYFNQLSLFDKLVDMETQQLALKQKMNQFTQQEPQVIISQFKTRFNQIKKNIVKRMGSSSFDQLAQKQLFGRVLPKHDPKKPKLALDIITQQSPELKEMLNSQRLKNINSQTIKQRDQYYKKIKARQARRKKADKDQGQSISLDAQIAEQELAQQGSIQIQPQQGPTGQRGFSTTKKRTASFRPRTPLQQANYILRYSQYIKDIINQYQGLFPQSRLKPDLQSRSTFLNPQNLKFQDGNDYITEDDLSKCLECMRDTNEAITIYSQFWIDLQVFKSRNINIHQYRNQVQSNYYSAVQKYVDIGLIKDVYQIEDGQDALQKVKYLNSIVAGFGQQFRIHEAENKKVIVKIIKLQNICPLDKLTKITKAKAQLQKKNHQFTQNQIKVFNKYKYQMIQQGQIPHQVRKQFNIEQNKTIDDLLLQLSSQVGIYKKDIQMILNLQNFTQDQIGQDIGLQVQLEKVRLAEKQSNLNDYAKDPSNIQIRDKEGYFKVSKFRQI